MGKRISLGLSNALKIYVLRLKAFQPNARLYLFNVMIAGIGAGIFRLLFNFYVLSMGYDEALVGNLVTASSLTALLMALPMGYAADWLGRKRSLLISGMVTALAFLAMVIAPSAVIFYATNMMFGLAQSLAAVTMAPFLMENSGDEERTYLFSFGSGFQMASVSVGNWIGGYLPTWMGSLQGVEPTSTPAYGGALLVVAGISALALFPLVFLHTPRGTAAPRTVFAPFSYAAKQPAKLARLILPMLLTSIGAGLIMPFMNVFYRAQYHQSDPAIGALFAWGSLAMGIGLLIAPPLADRMGKIQLVVITQGLSIPFLAMLGYAPWFWMSAAAYYMRVALMNMSSPVYSTFVMEQVEPDSRAMVASLVSMAWNFGWAFSPTISGWMQVYSGFTLPYAGTIIFYSLSVYLYWAFFWRKRPTPQLAPSSAPGN